MRAAIVHGAKRDVAKNRVDKAIEEYEKGEVDFLIMTGMNESKIMAEYAVENGVPRSSIGIEDMSRSTIENLYFSKRRFLEKFGSKEVKCVTSWWHAPRVNYDANIILREYEVDIISSVDERIKNEIEKDIKLEKIKLLVDKTVLELFHYLYWPDRLKNVFGSIKELF